MFDNKFGMFIHWGIYSLTELHEQAFIRYSMPRKEYEGLKDKFNPVKYNPEEWVLLAKKAGMKYICFTAKHHDGFCMWDTAYTDYKITNTPYKKDVLKELAAACEKHGVLLSLYYSNPDWHYEYGYNPKSSHQWLAVNKDNPDTARYREYVKNQITELLTNYGKIYTLFWDIPPRITDKSLNELVRKLQPEIFINDRGWDKGDFSTPEREYQKKKASFFTRMTEACNSVGAQSWGYRKNEDFYSIRYLTCSIDEIMAKGGSYLLNVGPSHTGEITPDYAERIKKVGDWYNRMQGCLESAEPDVFGYGVMEETYIATKKNGKTYLHFYQGIKSSAVAIKNYPNLPKEVKLLNNGKKLSFEEDILPEFLDWKINDGKGDGKGLKMLHIYGIPIDDFASEPIVIEIKW